MTSSRKYDKSAAGMQIEMLLKVKILFMTRIKRTAVEAKGGPLDSWIPLVR